jgi:hypothetical protein
MTGKSIEDWLQAIGQAIADEVDGEPDGAFLYAEVKPGMIYDMLLLEREGNVEYIVTSNALSELILDAWYASAPGKGWATISYAVVGNAFDVSFQYPDELSEADDPEDRSRRILKARYGDRPIKYPPPPPDAMEL